MCGLGNGLVDVIVDVTNEEFSRLGIEKGTMTLVAVEEQSSILHLLGSRTQRLVAGGSVGNSVIAAAQLGGASAFITSLGDDRYGLFYDQEARHLNVELGTALKVGETTGTCLALITPDAERTMRTALGAACKLAPDDVSEGTIQASHWLFIEGYVFANPEPGPAAIDKAVALAKKHGTKVALTLSEQFIPQVFGAHVGKILADCDLLFCNEPEACALSGKAHALDAFRSLAKRVQGLVVTRGADGALVQHQGQAFHVPAFPCQPVDLLGAGDMLAGSYLYGIQSGIDAPRAARAACFLAMQVITRYGARIQTGLKEYWREGLNAAPQSEPVAVSYEGTA